MGNQAPKTQHKQIHKEEEFKISHERFQRYKYIPSTDQLETTIDVPEQKEMKAWQKDVSTSINGFQNKDNLLLPIKHQYQPKGWCGNTGSAKIYYENFPYLFSQEIENRISMGKYFEEEQLWYLLYSLVASAKDFSKIDKKIGDVRPHNIFINEEGQIKIANIYSWPYEKTNFQKTAFEKQITYLSPEQINLLEKGKLENTTNKVKSEAFSIGLTLLQTGLLIRAAQLYDLENRTINTNKLNQYITEWHNLQFANEGNIWVSYSNLLKNIVASLCQVDAQNRLNSLEVLDILSPYENEIMNLKAFDKKSIEANYLPDTLRQQIQPQFQSQTQTQPQPVQRIEQQVYYSHPTNTIPQPTVISTQQQVYPPQQVYSIPPQNYRVVNNEVKVQGTYGAPPPDVIRQVQYPEPVRVSQTNVNFNSVSVRAPVDPQNGYRDLFNKYASNQPERQNPGNFIPNQQFQKYTISRQQQPQPPVYQASQQTFTQNFSTPQGNTFNIPSTYNIGTTEFKSTNQYSSTSGAQKTQFVSNTAPQYQTTIPQSYVSSSTASDFLKKIDQQLQNSRNLYPS